MNEYIKYSAEHDDGPFSAAPATEEKLERYFSSKTGRPLVPILQTHSWMIDLVAQVKLLVLELKACSIFFPYRHRSRASVADSVTLGTDPSRLECLIVGA